MSSLERRCQCILDPVNEDQSEMTITHDFHDPKSTFQESGSRGSCVDWRSLQSRCWQTRREAVSRLAYCGQAADGKVSAEVIIALRAALGDGHWQVRRQSVYAFQELGAEAVHQALPALWHACSDRDSCVRVAALSVLHFFGEEVPRTPFVRVEALSVHTDEKSQRLDSIIEDETSSVSTSTSKSRCLSAVSETAADEHQSDYLADTPADDHTLLDGRHQVNTSLCKPAGDKLGVKCAASLSRPFKVPKKEQGTISDCNQSQSPRRQLFPGDRISAMNSVENDSEADLNDKLSEGHEALEAIFSKMNLQLGSNTSAQLPQDLYTSNGCTPKILCVL